MANLNQLILNHLITLTINLCHKKRFALYIQEVASHIWPEKPRRALAQHVVPSDISHLTSLHPSIFKTHPNRKRQALSLQEVASHIWPEKPKRAFAQHVVPSDISHLTPLPPSIFNNPTQIERGKPFLYRRFHFTFDLRSQGVPWPNMWFHLTSHTIYHSPLIINH